MQKNEHVRCEVCGYNYISYINEESGEEIKVTPCICDLDCSKYKKAYNILMEYWDEFGEDLKQEIDKKLINLGL